MRSNCIFTLLLLLIACCIALPCGANATSRMTTQDSISIRDTARHSWFSFDGVRGTKLERVAWVTGASLAFSLFDYVGYNIVRENNRAPDWYRILQVSIQCGLSYFLLRECGLPSAISFNLIWWTWGDDIGYNGWANLINPRAHDGHWENREHNGLRDNEITWAYWTPIGMLRPYKSRIPRDVLIPQAIIGFSVAVAIL